MRTTVLQDKPDTLNCLGHSDGPISALERVVWAHTQRM